MPFRSLLFTPATRLDRVDAALASGADWVALDLEDGVGAKDKAAAREALTAFASRRLGEASGRIAVRVNSLSLAEGVRDVAAMLDWPAWPGMVILPKVEAAAQARQIASLAAGRAGAVLLAIETALGVANAAEIARAAPEGAALGYGSADHMAETGGSMCEPSLACGRAAVVNAAALAGIPAMDGAWLSYRDEDGLKAEARLARSMGFAGKVAIHPSQVGPINAAFSPSREEMASARALLEASGEAGGGAFAFEGRMVDAPVLARARRMLEAGGRGG